MKTYGLSIVFEQPIYISFSKEVSRLLVSFSGAITMDCNFVMTYNLSHAGDQAFFLKRNTDPFSFGVLYPVSYTNFLED